MMVEATKRKKTGPGSINPFMPEYKDGLPPELSEDRYSRTLYDSDPETEKLKDQKLEKQDHGSGEINPFLPIIEEDESERKSLQKEALSVMGDKTEIDMGSGLKLVRYGYPGSETEKVKLEVESDTWQNPINLDELPHQDQQKVQDWLEQEKVVKKG